MVVDIPYPWAADSLVRLLEKAGTWRASSRVWSLLSKHEAVSIIELEG